MKPPPVLYFLQQSILDLHLEKRQQIVNQESWPNQSFANANQSSRQGCCLLKIKDQRSDETQSIETIGN
jgi:hypothetical protein